MALQGRLQSLAVDGPAPHAEGKPRLRPLPAASDLLAGLAALSALTRLTSLEVRGAAGARANDFFRGCIYTPAGPLVGPGLCHSPRPHLEA